MSRTAWFFFALAAALAGCSRPAPQQSATSVWPLHAHPGDCRQCHDSLSNGVATTKPATGACADSSCHRILDPPPRLVHGPVAVGECRACHLPHSSAEPHLLASPAPRLCTGCHDKLYTCPAAGDLASASCVSCHAPHGGSPKLVRPDAPRAGGQ